MLNDIAGWVAPIATMIAAMMTAANLGARVTGWGFVVFLVGSICWSVVGLSSGQTNLVATNAFLTIVNLVGVWRWLGLQRAYEDGAKSAKVASRRSSTASLFTAGGLSGMAVYDADGQTLGTAVDALIECRTGEVSYVVVATGGVGGVAEQLRAVSRDAIRFACERLTLDVSRAAFERLPTLADGEWPAEAPVPAMAA